MKYLIYFSITSILVTIYAIIYLNIMMFVDNFDNFQNYMEWIPTFLISTQSAILVMLYYNMKDKPSMIHSLCICIGLISCTIANILGTNQDNMTPILVMIMYIIAHILFAISRIFNIYQYVYKSDAIKIITGIMIIISLQALYLPYVIITTISKQLGYFIIIKSCLLSFFIVFSLISNYIYLIIHENKCGLYSFIGIVFFCIYNCIMLIHDVNSLNENIRIVGILFYWIGTNILSWGSYKSNSLLSINEIF